MFVFMEISSLASYILIAAGPDRRALTATFKYLIMGTVGATFYLIGVGLVYMMTGTLNFADIEMRIAEVADQRPILVAAGFVAWAARLRLGWGYLGLGASLVADGSCLTCEATSTSPGRAASQTSVVRVRDSTWSITPWGTTTRNGPSPTILPSITSTLIGFCT